MSCEDTLEDVQVQIILIKVVPHVEGTIILNMQRGTSVDLLISCPVNIVVFIGLFLG